MSELIMNAERNEAYQEGFTDAMKSIVHCKDCIRWKWAAEIGDGIYGCCQSPVTSKDQIVNRSFFCGDGQSEKGGKTNWEKWKESME